MSEVEVRPDVDLNELYDQDVPCKSCGKPAQLRTFGHRCHPNYPIYVCIKCWQRWLQQELDKNRRAGRSHFLCAKCGRRFPTIESFSDYRPF